MAKKLARTIKKAQKKPVAIQKRQAAGMGAYTDRVSRHVNLLLDPCGAELGPTAYRGRDGFINRFNAFFSVGPDPTISCSVFIYHPRLNRIYNRGVALFNDDIGNINFYGGFSSAGPGAAYLTANADETRTISACVQAFYVGTELDRQGLVYRGVVPARALSNAVNTVGTLSQLLQKRERTGDHTMETKWVPGPGNENYERTDITVNEFGDDNCVVILASGFAASKLLFSYRVVTNIEWLPAPAVGIMTPSPSTPDAPAGLERVRSAVARFGDWWLEAAHTVSTVGGVARRVYGATRTAVNAIAPATPLLLTL